MKIIKSVNEVAGKRFNNYVIEKIINDLMMNIDGYKKCKVYIEGKNSSLNVVLMFNRDFEVANAMDGSMEDIELELRLNFAKDFKKIQTYIIWK